MTTAAPGFTRYTAERPCPICAGWDRMPRGSSQRCFGYVTASGKTALCTREEKAGALPISGDTEAYAHPLHGACGCGAGENGAPDHSGHVKGQRGSGSVPGQRVEKRYQYRDERGEVLFEVERLWPKSFRQRAPDGKGGWKTKSGAMTGVRRVPYRLPELLADTMKLILVCEGEKDADTGRDALSLPATTNVGGAGKWTEEAAQVLVDRQRVPFIVPHNDFPDKFGHRAGQAGAEKTAALFHRLGLRPRILPVLGDGDGFDLYDWALAGGTREQMLEMVKTASVWVPPNTPANVLHLPVHQVDDADGNGHRFGQNGFHEGPDGLPAFTDTRNAERLIERHGETVRKDFTRGRKGPLRGWRTWDGKRWALDETEVMMLRAKDVVKHLPDELDADLNPRTLERLRKDCLGCESTGRLTALISNAGSLVPTTHETWDADPYLLNCENGTVDLRTGQLLEHRPDRYQSKLAPVDFDPGCETPVWTAFLERVFAGDADLIAFVQRAVGLSLVGKVIEHCLFVMWGTGRNGKSTFVNAWLELLGDYARPAAWNLLVDTKNPQHPTSIAELVGVRFVSTVETAATAGLSEALVKMLTGGDQRNARFLFEDAFTYWPSDTPWLATNHLPNITGNSEGIWRRVKLIPFNAKITEAEEDRDLPRKLRAEYPGILAWAVRGCTDWLARGLGHATAVDAATGEYRRDMDTLAAFLSERCVVDPDAAVAAGDLYKAYEAWCEETGERPASQRFFGIRLGERGFTRQKLGHDRKWHWMGLRLRDDTDGPGDETPPSPQQRRLNWDDPPDSPVENPQNGDLGEPNGPQESSNSEIKNGPRRVHESINPVKAQAGGVNTQLLNTGTTRAGAREETRIPGVMGSLEIASPPQGLASTDLCNRPERALPPGGPDLCPDCGSPMYHRFHVDHWDHDCLRTTCAARFRTP